MISRYDVLVIGAGHNGLTAAAVLARAGLRVLVLEKADHIGGCAITSELAPGVRCPTLAHRGALAPEVLSTLDLAAHGLQAIRSDVRACGVTGRGRALAIHANRQATSREIEAFSARDAAQYPIFLESIRAVAGVIRGVLSMRAPDLDEVSTRDLLALLRTTRQFRALGRENAHRLLRWLPMPVADFAGEWFESEPLRALMAADGVLGGFLGPRSAGSTAVVLLRASTDAVPIAPGWTARGGPGAIAAALAQAARQAGVELRTSAAVDGIIVKDGGAQGIVLGGEAIAARTVVSSLDPQRTLLGLVDPVHLPPVFSRHAQNIRMRGTLAKVNYAVDTLPEFVDLRDRPQEERRAILSGCLRLATHIDAIERAFDAAKYGRLSDEPWIELTVPSIGDDSLAPAGTHVVSVYAQFAPFTLRDTAWDAERDRLGDLVTRTIEGYAPGFSASVLAREVITPLDLEQRCGLTGGHIFHGELALDQLLLARPVLGWARYRTPLNGVYLCGAGTHPGLGLDGRSGLLAARQVLADLRR